MLHVLGGHGCRTGSWPVAVGDIEVVKGGVHGLDTGNSKIDFEGKFQGRPKIRLNLHGTLGLKVHPHCAVGLLRLCHLSHCCFLVVGRECTAVGIGQCQKLIKHPVNEGANTDLLEEFGVVCRLEKDASGVESNWTVKASVMCSFVKLDLTYPIIRSN